MRLLLGGQLIRPEREDKSMRGILKRSAIQRVNTTIFSAKLAEAVLILVVLLAWSLPAAAQITDPMNIEVTVAPTVPLTDVYFAVGGLITVQDGGQFYGGLERRFYYLNELPAATVDAPDVIRLSVPWFQIPYTG